MSTEERVKLTVEQLESILPDKDDVHTFMQGGFALIGADWSKDEVLKEAAEFSAELSGETATAMGHGAVIMSGRGAVFVETDTAKLAAFNP